MDKRKLFQTMQEIYESFESAGALPDTMTELGTRVQTGGRGDSSFVLTVAVGFRSLAGDHWRDFCEIYTGKPLTRRLESIAKGKLRLFWGKIGDRKTEFEIVARNYLRQVGE